jgi:hypothetical protein
MTSGITRRMERESMYLVSFKGRWDEVDVGEESQDGMSSR